jgi:transposase
MQLERYAWLKQQATAVMREVRQQIPLGPRERCLMTIPGIGQDGSRWLSNVIGDETHFACGRSVSRYFGLVPGERTTGGGGGGVRGLAGSASVRGPEGIEAEADATDTSRAGAALDPRGARKRTVLVSDGRSAVAGRTPAPYAEARMVLLDRGAHFRDAAVRPRCGGQ